jgi:hypothetical protein
MTKYQYQKILRKPSADTQFFEEYLESVGEHDRRSKFLGLLGELRAIYNSNPSYREVVTDLVQEIRAEYSREELETVIARSEKFSTAYMDIHDEWTKHVMENNIYYSTTVRAVSA